MKIKEVQNIIKDTYSWLGIYKKIILLFFLL